METTTLATLIAINDIGEVLKRYCRSMDRIDKELGYSVWHEHGTADYGEYFRGSGRGFIDWVSDMHRTLINHMHRISNISVRIADTAARSETYVIATHLVHSDAPELRFYHGRYLDEWSKRNHIWAIDSRRFVLEFAHVQRLEVSLEGTTLESSGARDRSDPVYGLFSP
jgi:SnoaL-like domain